jgi:hypothetical protein
MIGNVLEWYDFAICGYFAASIGGNFFPIRGLTPLVAPWLVGRTADQLAPAYLIMVAAAVSFFAAWRIKETYRMPLA